MSGLARAVNGAVDDDRGRGLVAQLGIDRGAWSLDVAITVPAGSTLAIIGPNGAGKSTALLAIAGAVALDRGHVTIDGRVLDAPAARPVPPERRGVAVVFQSALLFPHLRVLDNVAFGPRAQGAGRVEARAAASAWLERFGIAALADRRPAELSGGEAQRAALARALAVDPAVLLLDEPLAGLDVALHEAVQTELAAHLRAVGTAAILVTHSRADVAALADDVLVLDGGRVVQHGTLAALTAQPATEFVARFTRQ